MKTNSKQLINRETGEIFKSCREADRRYGWVNGTAWHIAAGRASDHEVRLEFVLNTPEADISEYDATMIEWLYNSKAGVKPLRCIETNQVFDCQRDADRYFNLPTGTVCRIMHGKVANPPYHFEYMNQVELSVPEIGDEELFKEIPEFSHYSISNFGRVMRNSTGNIKKPVKCNGKTGPYYRVMISTNSMPKMVSLKSLFDSAWRSSKIVFRDHRASRVKKPIFCITDNKHFDSYMECVSCYQFDYQQFREALHSSSSNRFTFKGYEFERL